MKRLHLVVCFLLIAFNSFSQDEFEKLLSDGVKLNDAGKFEEAIRKYDLILEKDKNNYLANFEKSYSLLSAGKYDDCISICQLLLEIDPGNKNGKLVYANWGTALDDKGKSDEAIKIYDKGLKAFPESYLLHFNKGITLALTNKPDDAFLSFQNALKYNPLHPGSHQAIGFLLKTNNRIASIMALFSFLLIEPDGQRAIQNYADMDALIISGIKDNPDGKGVTINIDASLLDKKNKKKENDFSSVEMIFSLSSALDKDEKFKDQNAAEKLDRKMQLLISMLEENKKDRKGFCWDFYAPFLSAIKSKDLLLTACYLATINSKDEAVNKWIDENKGKTDVFYNWLKEYKWNTK